MKTYCAWDNCTEQPSGKSKYCKVHKKQAREIWKANIADQQAEREARYETFEKIWLEAVEAGKRALAQTTPTPMVVQAHESPLDDNSPVVESWYEPQGACGFAWVKILPATCSFARWLKKNGHASSAYGGGLSIWVHAGGQSVELKSAYAHAMAQILNDHRDDLKMPANAYIYAQSRLD